MLYLRTLFLHASEHLFVLLFTLFCTLFGINILDSLSMWYLGDTSKGPSSPLGRDFVTLKFLQLSKEALQKTKF